MAPLVSVIMPTYNVREFVQQTIESVLAQTLSDLELIAVDDGSTDGTQDFIATIRDPRLTFVRAPHSGLPSVARNLAREHASGQLIAFIDGDDAWVPTKLHLQVSYLEAHRSAGLVHTAALHVVRGEPLPQAPRCSSSDVMSPLLALRQLLARNFIYTSSVLLSREALDRVGWFDTDSLMRGPEDLDLWLRLCEAGVAFGYVDEPLLHYRVRPESVSRDPLTDLLGTIVAIEKAHARCPDTYQSVGSIVRRRLHFLYQNLGVHKLTRGQPGAYKDILRSLALVPHSIYSWAWLVLALLGPRGTETILRWRRAILRTTVGSAGEAGQ